MATKLKLKEFYPSEHDEQCVVVSWAAEMVQWKKYPELALLYAVPNGVRYAGSDKQRAQWAAKMKAEGLKAGCPDLCLPIPRHSFGALYIEMKSTDPSASTTDLQEWWIDQLTIAGNHACVCRGAKEAINKLVWYLTL